MRLKWLDAPDNLLNSLHFCLRRRKREGDRMKEREKTRTKWKRMKRKSHNDRLKKKRKGYNK